VARSHVGVLIGATFVSLAFPATVVAQDAVEAIQPEFFVWLDEGYLVGVAIAVAALLGALFTVFTSIGGVLPGTAGKAKLDEEEARLLAYYKIFEDRLKAGGDAATITALGDQIDKLRDDIGKERRRQFGLGALLYLLLGVGVALALATSWLQAVVISAGWTAYIGTFGLKSDYTVRKEAKDEALSTLEEKVEKAPGVSLDEGEEAQVRSALAM
jgi:hypothetical protein